MSVLVSPFSKPARSRERGGRNDLRYLEACGYTGRVGYELFPLTDTKAAVRAIMEND